MGLGNFVFGAIEHAASRWSELRGTQNTPPLGHQYYTGVGRLGLQRSSFIRPKSLPPPPWRVATVVASHASSSPYVGPYAC